MVFEREVLIIIVLLSVISAIDPCEVCSCYEKDMFCNNVSLEASPEKSDAVVYVVYIEESNVTHRFLTTLTPNLRHLHIIDSNVSGIRSTSFQKLSKLILIEISGSKLKYISQNLFLKNVELKFIDLSWNQIDNVPVGTFFRQPGLTRIVLHGNIISGIRKGTFVINRQVKSLDLSFNRIRSIDPEAFNISNVPVGESYVFINIGDNALTEVLDETFSLCQHVTQLNLTNNKITRLGPRAFAGLVALSELLLGHNSIKQLTPGVFQPLANLNVVDLRSNLLRQINEDAFSASRTLSEINLSGNKIDQLHPLAFRSLQSLARLYLDDNLLTAVSAFQTPLPGLRYVGVRRNRIARLQRAAFSGGPSLQALDLSGNLITAIADGAFMANRRLETLQLQDNHIARLRCGALSNLTALQALDLGGNALQEFRLAAFSPLRRLRRLSVLLGGGTACDCSLFLGLSERGVQLDVAQGALSGDCARYFRMYDAGDASALRDECAGAANASEACDWEPEPPTTTEASRRYTSSTSNPSTTPSGADAKLSISTVVAVQTTDNSQDSIKVLFIILGISIVVGVVQQIFLIKFFSR